MAKAKTDGMTYPGEGNCYPQKLGDEGNLQAPGYENDVPSDWRRGMGPGGAQGKPGFCPTPSGNVRGATGGGSGVGGGPKMTAGSDSGVGRLQKAHGKGVR